MDKHAADAHRQRLRRLARRSEETMLVAAAVGLVTGLLVAGMDRLIVNVLLDTVTRLSPWIVVLMPTVGLALAAGLLHLISEGSTPSTADEYLKAYHEDGGQLDERSAVARVLASIATLGFGGPLGLEGPSIYLGAAIGSFAQRRMPKVLGNVDRRTLLVAGAAAGVAAIFKAPATGAIFAIEVPYQGDVGRRTLLPSLVAAGMGYLAFVAVNGTTPLFPISGSPPFNLVDLGGAVALGVAGGLVARAFAWALNRAKLIATVPKPAARVIGAGAALGTIYAAGRALTGTNILVGPGYGVLRWALDPHRGVWLLAAILVLRCAGSVATVAGGGAGGLFIPLVVAGALLGRTAAGVFGTLDNSLFLVVGVAAVLGAGYRVPLAAIMFVAESTGRPGFVVPALLAAVAAELMMGRSSVTAYQRNPTLGVTTSPAVEQPSNRREDGSG